jgi:hypothetical protein
MRKVVRTSLLVMAMTVAAHAGHMGNGVTEPPPPPTTTTQTTNGTTDSGAEQPKAVTVTGIALNLLETLLGLF